MSQLGKAITTSESVIIEARTRHLEDISRYEKLAKHEAKMKAARKKGK